MAITMRKGLLADFNPDRMLPGEWAVSVDADTKNQIVYMCFAPGIVKRMGTMEDFEDWFEKAFEESITPYETEFKEVQEECESAVGEVITVRNSVVNTYLPQMQSYAETAEEARDDAEATKEWIDNNFNIDVTKKSTSGLVDTYDITYQNTKHFEFEVTNGAQGPQGPQGPAGPEGPQGPQGPQGPAGASGTIATTSTPGIVKPDGTSITVDADGTIHSSGGGSGASTADNVSYDNTESATSAENVQDALDDIYDYERIQKERYFNTDNFYNNLFVSNGYYDLHGFNSSQLYKSINCGLYLKTSDKITVTVANGYVAEKFLFIKYQDGVRQREFIEDATTNNIKTITVPDGYNYLYISFKKLDGSSFDNSNTEQIRNAYVQEGENSTPPTYRMVGNNQALTSNIVNFQRYVPNAFYNIASIYDANVNYKKGNYCSYYDSTNCELYVFKALVDNKGKYPTDTSSATIWEKVTIGAELQRLQNHPYKSTGTPVPQVIGYRDTDGKAIKRVAVSNYNPTNKPSAWGVWVDEFIPLSSLGITDFEEMITMTGSLVPRAYPKNAYNMGYIVPSGSGDSLKFFGFQGFIDGYNNNVMNINLKHSIISDKINFEITYISNS